VTVTRSCDKRTFLYILFLRLWGCPPVVLKSKIYRIKYRKLPRVKYTKGSSCMWRESPQAVSREGKVNSEILVGVGKLSEIGRNNI
jgi:hypothetical protein